MRTSPTSNLNLRARSGCDLRAISAISRPGAHSPLSPTTRSTHWRCSSVAAPCSSQMRSTANSSTPRLVLRAVRAVRALTRERRRSAVACCWWATHCRCRNIAVVTPRSRQPRSHRRPPPSSHAPATWRAGVEGLERGTRRLAPCARDAAPFECDVDLPVGACALAGCETVTDTTRRQPPAGEHSIIDRDNKHHSDNHNNNAGGATCVLPRRGLRRPARPLALRLAIRGVGHAHPRGGRSCDVVVVVVSRLARG